MDDLILLVTGVFMSVIGIINMRGNISTIHSYNRRKVKEEDVLKYGKVVGIGTLIIGLALIVSFFMLVLKSSISIGYVVLPAIVVGVIIILYGQFKYNNGIF